MKFLLDLIPAWFLVAYATLAGFVLGMGLYRAYLANTLTRALWLLFGWFVPVFFVLDFVCNTFCGTLLLLELPQWRFGADWRDSEVLLTARLSRWEKVNVSMSRLDTWRIGCARWICHNLLDPLSPNGPHCH